MHLVTNIPMKWSSGLSFPVLCAFPFLLVICHGSAMASENQTFDAGDLVRTARMVEGIIDPDPDFADLTGDGEVTEADLALMMRLVHGREPPEILEEKTIGAGGGLIGDPQTMELEVPPGAFHSDTDLVLHRLPEGEGPEGGIETGPLYQVSGIPLDSGDTLTVRIPLPEGFDPAKAFLEIGEPGFSTNGFDWQYETLVGDYVDGMLVWEMEPIPAQEWPLEPASAEPEVNRFEPEAMGEVLPASYPAGYTYIRWRVSLWESITGDRFDLMFSTDERVFYKEELWNLIDDLEDVYAMLTEAPAGFDLSNVSWPVRVYMKNLDGEYGAMISSRRGDYIELDRSLLTMPELARITAGHEFFHIVQAAYNSPRANLWLDEATATWFEKHMAADPSAYAPGTFRERPREALRGIHVVPYVSAQLAWWPGNWFEWKTADAQNRGYALSGLLEFIDRRRGVGLAGIRGLYEEIRGGTHPVLALQNLSPNFSLDWREYTKAAFDDPVWDAEGCATVIQDDDLAFNAGAEGPYGRTVEMHSLEDFSTMHTWPIHVQQMGGRSLTLSLIRPDALPLLPDRIRMIGEVRAENMEDVHHLRLMAVLKGGPGNRFDPIATQLDRDEVVPERPDTRRIEVSFQKPAGRFHYMLGVFNDNLLTPYDKLTPVTLRSYLGAYQVGGYVVDHPYGNVAGCRVEKAVIEGDLGDVNLEVVEHSAMEGMRILKLRLPHEHVDSLRVTIDAALDPPLTRSHYDPGIMWYNNAVIGGTVTVTASDGQGWRVDALHLEENNVGPLISAEEARTSGIELPAPGPDETAIYNLLYYFSANLVTSFDTEGYPFDITDSSWSTDQWFIAPLRIEIQGSRLSETPEEDD